MPEPPNAVASVFSSSAQWPGARTPIEEFFGDELLRRWFGDVPERQMQPQKSLGSGVIVDPSGIVLTNAHVVERATEIEVVTADGKKHKAKGQSSGGPHKLHQIESLGKISVPASSFILWPPQGRAAALTRF